MDSPTLPSHGSPTPAPAGTVIGPSTCTVTPSGARNANCASSPRCSRRIWKLGLRADHTFTASRHLRNPAFMTLLGSGRRSSCSSVSTPPSRRPSSGDSVRLTSPLWKIRSGAMNTRLLTADSVLWISVSPAK